MNPIPSVEIIKRDMMKYYESLCSDLNNISYWLPRVNHCGLRTPNTWIFKVPAVVVEAFYNDNPQNPIVYDYLNRCVRPVLGDRRRFIKNGTFSDKFSFEKCIVQDDTLVFSFININYGALVLDAGGLSELALRRVIPSDSRFTPRIYGGLPLRTEIRCFYDFDQQKLMGSVNYWDYEYVFPQLRSKTDIIIFSHERERMEHDFEAWLPRVEEAAKRHLPQADLKGQWSVDFLVDEGGDIWLIDMALARQSAYFKEKLKW